MYVLWLFSFIRLTVHFISVNDTLRVLQTSSTSSSLYIFFYHAKSWKMHFEFLSVPFKFSYRQIQNWYNISRWLETQLKCLWTPEAQHCGTMQCDSDYAPRCHRWHLSPSLLWSYSSESPGDPHPKQEEGEGNTVCIIHCVCIMLT